MAKFITVQPAQAEPETGLALWQDPDVHQALAVMLLAAIVTVFVAMLLRSLIGGDRKPRGKPAALTGEGYSGAGLSGNATRRQVSQSINRK